MVAPPLSSYIVQEVYPDTVLSYAQPGITKRRLSALGRGLVPWEMRFDLHGLLAEEAQNRLYQFITQARANNRRCILVIHGKGGQSAAPPVLKNLVNRWLPQLEEVLAFHSALPRDGGTGAVYLLLKG